MIDSPIVEATNLRRIFGAERGRELHRPHLQQEAARLGWRPRRGLRDALLGAPVSAERPATQQEPPTAAARSSPPKAKAAQ